MLGAVDFGMPSAGAWARSVASLFSLSCSVNERVCLVGKSGFGSDVLASNISSSLLLLAGNIDLYNRFDLIGTLGLPRAAPDSDVVLAAYKRWDAGCAEFLSGDFAFGIWDGRRNRVFACRDQIGSRSLYYSTNGSRFAFSNEPESLLRIPGISRVLNRRKLAGMTMPGGQHFHEEETLHAGIMSLPPGAWLKAGSDGVRRERYWIPEVRSDIVPRKPEDAYALLRDLLFRSVERRICHKKSPAVLLSGGLDSSAIATIAAQCLEKTGQTLIAVSAVLPERSNSDFTDEREYIDEFRSCQNIRLEYVATPETGPFDGIEEPKRFEATFLRTSRAYLYEALGQVARQHRADLILTGNFGEIGATTDGRGYFLEMLTRFRWGALASTLRDYYATTGISPLRALGSEVYDLVSPERAFRPMVLLMSSFGAECDGSPVRVAQSANHRDRQLSLIRMQLRKHAVAGEEFLGGAPVRYPFLDKDVVEYCLAAPGSLKIRNGYTRYLIRGALKNDLPPKILWRTDKKPFASDYPLRFNAQLGKARHFVEAIGPNDPVRDIVNVEGLKKLLIPITGATAPWTALIQAPATIRLICFLRQFSEFRR
jgi:asparagine synthase (glutamine-hydrolysing)